MTKIEIKEIKNMASDNFMNEYNDICINHKKNNSTLPDLTNRELCVWIAGQTLNFGRDLKDSLENACIHMEDRVKAERLFGFEHIA